MYALHLIVVTLTLANGAIGDNKITQYVINPQDDVIEKYFEDISRQRLEIRDKLERAVKPKRDIIPRIVLSQENRHLLKLEKILLVTFVPTTKEFGRELEEVRKFCHNRAYFDFVICSELNSTFPEKKLKRAWNHGVSKVAVVFVSGKTLNIVTYNPFYKTMNELKFYDDRFKEMFSDLNGHVLKAVATRDFPRNYFEEGKWIGYDITVLNLVIENMNASLEIVESDFYESAAVLLEVGAVELCAIPKLYDLHFTSVEFSYPFKTDSLVAVLPKPNRRKPYMMIFQFFYSKILFVIFGLPAITSYLHFKLSKRPKYGFDLFFDYFGIIFGIAVPRLERKITFLVGYWLVFCLVVSVYFNSSLLSDLVNVKFDGEIKKIFELRAAPIRLYTTSLLADLLPESYRLNDKLDLVSLKEIRNMLLSQNATRTHGYIIPKSTARSCLKYVKKVYKTTQLKEMPTTLVTHMSTFMFRKGSVFLEKINLNLLRVTESGLPPTDFINNDDELHSNILTFSHLLGAFYIIFIGHVMSFCVFLLELWVYYRKELGSVVIEKLKGFASH